MYTFIQNVMFLYYFIDIFYYNTFSIHFVHFIVIEILT